jgi:hypothetical protein
MPRRFTNRWSVVAENSLMGAAQRPRSSQLTWPFKAAALVLCLLGAAVTPASGAEPTPAPEAAPPSAPAAAKGAEGPVPDVPPQTTQPLRSALSPGAAAPRTPAPTNTYTYASPHRAFPSASSTHARRQRRRPAPHGAPATRRAGRAHAHHKGLPPAASAAVVEPSRPNSTLLLLASLALGLVAVAGFVLLQMLMRFERVSHARAAP